MCHAFIQCSIFKNDFLKSDLRKIYLFYKKKRNQTIYNRLITFRCKFFKCNFLKCQDRV